ncbi:hypothetical protein I6G82_06495 [Lysinibacillus macroides]|uniref:hypothetical protein n=1 Tax=Lysinibacillus macroides TaxID=33935 RepID=UPI0006B44B30|nr:hypothetical protein [Lysinibacillus macroides]QPR69258.1 hypothetical protein I6G82_06495 [Lysinibacillus macroides]
MKKLLQSIIISGVLLSTTACGLEQDSFSNDTTTKKVASQIVADATVNQKTKIASMHADFIIYDSLSEIEKNADSIVLAEFTGQRQLNEYKTAEGYTFHQNSISTVNILKAFKGEIDVGSTIQTFEPGFFQKEDEYVNLEGYNLMNEAGKYILFLKKNEAGPVFTIVGMYQGKYDVTAPNQVDAQVNKTDIESEYLGENVDQFNKLKQEVLAKYK